MVVGDGFEPSKLARQIYSLIPLATREPHHKRGRIIEIKAGYVNAFVGFFNLFFHMKFTINILCEVEKNS